MDEDEYTLFLMGTKKKSHLYRGLRCIWRSNMGMKNHIPIPFSCLNEIPGIISVGMQMIFTCQSLLTQSKTCLIIAIIGWLGAWDSEISLTAVAQLLSTHKCSWFEWWYSYIYTNNLLGSIWDSYSYSYTSSTCFSLINGQFIKKVISIIQKIEFLIINWFKKDKIFF